jgi:hypothetical protein
MVLNIQIIEYKYIIFNSYIKVTQLNSNLIKHCIIVPGLQPF